LFNFPRDYQDLSDLRPIAQLEEDKPQSVHGVIEEVELRGRGVGKAIVGVLLRQGDHYVRGIWFNVPFMFDKFKRGQEVLFSGKPRLKGGRWEMSHPHVQWLEADDGQQIGGEILPIYSLTEGLKQSNLRQILRQAVEAYADLVEER